MSSLLDTTNSYVSDLLDNQLSKDIVYHNVWHTKRVYKSTKEIVDNTTLNEHDTQVVLLASLLHDIGYIDGPEDHEDRSAKMAREYLKSKGAKEQLINDVAACILATKMEHVPQNQLEKIIRDADASHFAKDYYLESSEHLRNELKNLNIANHSKLEWAKINIDLFENQHSYNTEYAQNNWTAGKAENLKRLLIEVDSLKTQKKMVKKEKLKVKFKDESPEKAIQSMFRVTLKNHIKLSDIADTKANILLSVNAIIISLALSNLIPKLDNPSNAYLIYPTLIFIIFSIASMVLSVLATRPNVTSGQFTKEDVINKKVNLLFFGNFHKMGHDEYQWAMNEMINDKAYIYSSMTKDLYFLGVVLSRKYKILRLTYTVFIIGIVLSVIAFGIAFQWAGDIREAMQ
jgi:predicted metal-dependent HD superfamily phosphohydrolase